MPTTEDKVVSDDSIKDAEFQRLISEKERNDAERLKLEHETKEIQKRLQQRWFSNRILVQSAIGGLVAAALLAAWGIGYLQPILLRSLELNELETEINTRKVAKLIEIQKEISKELERVKQENEILSDDRDKIIQNYESRYEKIDDKLKDLVATTDPLDETQQQLKNDLQEEVDLIQNQLADLRQAQSEAAIRIESLNKLTTNIGFLCVTPKLTCLISEPKAPGNKCSCADHESGEIVFGIVE